MPDAPSDANIVTRQETIEVITPDGKPLQGTANLASIFDKMEAGKSLEQATEETMAPEPKTKKEKAPKPEPEPTPEPEAKPAEPTPEPEPQEEPAPKKTAKSLEEELANQDEKKNPKVELPKIDDAEPSEEDLKVLPQDKPKTAKRIQALLTKVTKEAEARATTQKERDEKAARVAELEAKLAEVKPVDPATQEQVKQQLEELAQYRRRYELDKDPQVQAKFDGRIKDSEEAIVTTLKANGATEGLLKTIADEGGWAKFSDSNKKIPIAGEDEPITAAELAERIRKALPRSHQLAIDQSVMDAIQAKRDKDRFFSEETKKANDYFAQREAAQKKTQEDWENQHKEAQKLSDEFYKKLAAENAWVNEKPVPPGASPEERAAIEEDNKFAKQVQGELQRYKSVKTMPEILGVLSDAVQYHHQRRRADKLASENESLKATIEKMRANGKVTSRSGSVSGGAAAPVVAAKPKAPQSLEEALNQIENGDTE